MQDGQTENQGEQAHGVPDRPRYQTAEQHAAQLAERTRALQSNGADTEGVDVHLDRLASGDMQVPEHTLESYLASVDANLGRIEGERQAEHAANLEERDRLKQEQDERSARAEQQRQEEERRHERGYRSNSFDIEQERKKIRGERAKSELAEVPLAEMTPQMVESVKAAVEKGVAPIDMPEEFKVLAGVRVDDVGTFEVTSESYEPDIAEKAREQYGRTFSSGVLPRVGTYTGSNNGAMSYVDHMGRIFTAPYTDVLMSALYDAGYEHASGYVPCSNADMPADAERITELCIAREVKDRLSTLQGLSALGIDRSEERANLIKGIRTGIADTHHGEFAARWQKTLEKITTEPQEPDSPPSTEVEGRDLPGRG